MTNLDIDIFKNLDEILSYFKNKPYKLGSNIVCYLIHLLNYLPSNPQQEKMVIKLKETNFLNTLKKSITYMPSDACLVLSWNLMSLRIFDEGLFQELLNKIELPLLTQDLQNYFLIHQLYNYLKKSRFYLKNEVKSSEWKDFLSLEKIRKVYQNLDSDLEELSLQRGHRRPPRVTKTEIFDILSDLNVVSRNHYTDSFFKIDILVDEKKLKGIKFYEEDCFNMIDKEICLKTFFMNEIELLESEGWSILCIRLMDYEKVGKDSKSLEEEKDLKKKYILEELNAFLN